jgi:hypothetical protein
MLPFYILFGVAGAVVLTVAANWIIDWIDGAFFDE